MSACIIERHHLQRSETSPAGNSFLHPKRNQLLPSGDGGPHTIWGLYRPPFGSSFSHVFLDEFQDTTKLQYDLLKTAFLNSGSVLTAVGGTKQRIMLWAGAMDGIFKTFKNDFSAIELPLLMNFRSAPRFFSFGKQLLLYPGESSRLYELWSTTKQ